MDIKVSPKKKNPLLNREESMAAVSHQGKPTPIRKELLSGIAKALKSSEELVVIDKIFTRKGIASCNVSVLVYSKKEDIPKEKLEKQKRRLEKKKPKAAEEKPAEKPPEKKEESKEKPAEEGKKEEPKEKPTEKKEEPKEEKPPEKKETKE